MASHYAPVNGLELYCEVYGPNRSSLPPLVLLHGGLGFTGMFADLLPDLPDDRQIVLLDKLGDLMRRPYDWSDEVAALSMPVLYVSGDADSFPPTHGAEFYTLQGGGQRDAGWDGAGMPASRLAILPGTTHYDILASTQLAGMIAAFLTTT